MSNKPIPNTPPKDQFTTDVLPPYEEFLACSTLEHRAKAAVQALSNFAEHVFVYYQHHDPTILGGTKNVEAFVTYLAHEKHCEALKIIWDIALANKHRFLYRPASREQTVTSATDVFVAGGEEPLRLALNGGRQLPIADVLKAGINFWQRWLQQP